MFHFGFVDGSIALGELCKKYCENVSSFSRLKGGGGGGGGGGQQKEGTHDMVI